MRHCTVGFLILVISTILIGCEDSSEQVSASLEKKIEQKESIIENVKKEVEQLQKELQSKNQDVLDLEEKQEHTEELLHKSLSYLNENQQQKLANSQYKYTLEVNDNPVPKDGSLEIKKEQIKVSLIQRTPNHHVLPTEISRKGRISEDYYTHIKEIAPAPEKTFFTDGTIVTGIHHQFNKSNLQSNITFSITRELKKRLGLHTTSIQVKVK
ncbi:hypothetical protein [Pontibacillus yanchengensis]|uniref:Lipoprotein n=1 Tax=Pontibacillus yanchengensis Y32 TaxID=1385514 RepID=A0A0A2TG44_9BACI|nr:hypothetical protein [Pontibacillus yanchengensis]KGP73388.1 hypothetical protein N782_05750 [Pontibacillus yanchengensis Y32]